jgi:hypothetical protein
MADFQEYPKMLYHKKKGNRSAKSAEEEATLKRQGYTTEAPKQFEEEAEENGENGDDLTREPALVSEIDQEKTRLAGNQGAKDPKELLGENPDEHAEDPEPAARPGTAKKGK